MRSASTAPTSTRTRSRSARCCRSRPAPVPRIAPTARRASAIDTGLEREALMELRRGRRTRAQARARPGATRFCMGAAYRSPKAEQLDAGRRDGARGARARHRDLRDARHADAGAGARAQGRRASTTTTTTSTRRESSTARSSRRAPTRTGSIRCRPCATRGSTCVAAASSAWARASRTASRCCTRSRRCPNTRRACRSTSSCRSRARRSSAPRSRRSARFRARHRGGAHADAALARAAVGGPQRDERRNAGAVFPGRRELDLLRRKAADDRQSGHGAGSRAVQRAGRAA